MASRPIKILTDAERELVTPIAWARVDGHAQPLGSVVRTTTPKPGSVSGNRPIDAGAPVTLSSEVEQEQAERRGFERGMAEGSRIRGEQATAELQAASERWARSAAELPALRAQIMKASEADLVKLSMAIARKILHRELTIDPDSIEGLVRVALEKLGSREIYRIRACPDQEQPLRKVLTGMPGAPRVEVVADPALQYGDMVFETPQGTLDASLEAQVREIERGFTDRLKS